MTKSCELCGRGMAIKTLTPTYWQHTTVCQRARCEAAAHDALHAIERDRERHSELVGAIARRHQEQMVSIGWRHDAMAALQRDREEWWATEIAAKV